MEVKLLAYTSNPDILCADIATICYKVSKETEEEKLTLLSNIIRKGHLSIIEHANFTFLIEGISRVASHQLVRHRMASYTQQSLRYTKAEDFNLPKSLQDNFEVKFYMSSLYSLYNSLIEKGIKKEDARYILPNAVTSDIVVTMNARELRHFFELRLDVAAQTEIRELAKQMLTEVQKVTKVLFSDLYVNEKDMIDSNN
jgi:thymidylate synthase (FAD)